MKNMATSFRGPSIHRSSVKTTRWMALGTLTGMFLACSHSPSAMDGGADVVFDGDAEPTDSAPSDSARDSPSDSPFDGSVDTDARVDAAAMMPVGWTYEERVVLFLTNRVRAAPGFFNAEWALRTGAPSPSPPLHGDDPLHEAARFQAEHIDSECSLCMNHASCCVLGRVGAEVQCTEPAPACGGTGPRERVSLWSPHYSGENAAQGSRTPEDTVLAWILSSGHFANMNGAHTLLGVGQSGNVWVQNFGNDGSAPPTFGMGVHYRRMLIEGDFVRSFRPDPAPVRMFGIMYHAPGAGPPREAYVVVDDERHELVLTHGVADHGSYEAEVALGSDCSRYTFHLVDGAGVVHIDPSVGHRNASLEESDDCSFAP